MAWCDSLAPSTPPGLTPRGVHVGGLGGVICRQGPRRRGGELARMSPSSLHSTCPPPSATGMASVSTSGTSWTISKATTTRGRRPRRFAARSGPPRVVSLAAPKHLDGSNGCSIRVASFRARRRGGLGRCLPDHRVCTQPAHRRDAAYRVPAEFLGHAPIRLLRGRGAA